MRQLFNKSYILLWIIILLLFLSSCSQDNELSVQKPPSVPDSAEFFGGYDGWIWLDCDVESFDKLECAIYDRNGSLGKTAFLRPCLNLKPKYNSIKRQLSNTHDSVFVFENIYFYEYRPAKYPDSNPDGQALADKYYGLLGVGDNCQPVGSELQYLGSE